MAKIAIVGDVHTGFDSVDVSYFNDSDYDLLLFVGDLGNFIIPWQTYRICTRLAALEKPALLVPGNHDVINPLQLVAEMYGLQWLGRLSGAGHAWHHRHLKQRLRPVVMGSYSAHPFRLDGLRFDVIVARPYAMGGSEMSFAPFLRKRFAVHDEADSATLLRRAVDRAQAERLLFLAHNGPAGLGERPGSIWGCDFDPERGDFGDRDLATAIAYAQQDGKEVIAVVAGHMHLRTEKGVRRPWHVEQDGIHYVNAARVPRIFAENGQMRRHHISLTLDDSTASFAEVLV